MEGVVHGNMVIGRYFYLAVPPILVPSFVSIRYKQIWQSSEKSFEGKKTIFDYHIV